MATFLEPYNTLMRELSSYNAIEALAAAERMVGGILHDLQNKAIGN